MTGRFSPPLRPDRLQCSWQGFAHGLRREFRLEHLLFSLHQLSALTAFQSLSQEGGRMEQAGAGVASSLLRLLTRRALWQMTARCRVRPTG